MNREVHCKRISSAFFAIVSQEKTACLSVFTKQSSSHCRQVIAIQGKVWNGYGTLNDIRKTNEFWNS